MFDFRPFHNDVAVNGCQRLRREKKKVVGLKDDVKKLDAVITAMCSKDTARQVSLVRQSVHMYCPVTPVIICYLTFNILSSVSY